MCVRAWCVDVNHAMLVCIQDPGKGISMNAKNKKTVNRKPWLAKTIDDATARAIGVIGYADAADTIDGQPAIDKMIAEAKQASRDAQKVVDSAAPDAVKKAVLARAAKAQSVLAKALADEASKAAAALQSATDRLANNPADPMAAAEVELRSTLAARITSADPAGVDLIDYFTVVELAEYTFAMAHRYAK